MYLKKFKLTNYRKFLNDNNVIEFISSRIIKTKKDLNSDGINEESESNDEVEQSEIIETDVASDTTLIIGKNNAGKTTVITALEALIKNNSVFGSNDFNYRYLHDYIEHYDYMNPSNAPYIEFVMTICLETDSDDRVTNIVPFMLVDDVNNNEVDICIRYEVADEQFFKSKMEKIPKPEDPTRFAKFLELLDETKYVLNYYNKKGNQIKSFKLAELCEIQCIKANNVKNDHCLSEGFNKIINYKYNAIHGEKEKLSTKIEEINNDLTKNINGTHTQIIKKVVAEILSSTYLGVNLRANITFEKLMRDLLKYEYVENDENIPEDQFGLGYTNLVMIITSIIDYIEKYPDTSFNSKINLIAIEEPETFMHPQMQELFIKNINNALQVLLSSKYKNVNSQIIISTHSSHILNSKIHSSKAFDNICYLYEKDKNAVIVNLNNSKVTPEFEQYEKLNEFKFLKKHIKYKVSELFFSDAVIFVEGFVEENILPNYIEKREDLGKSYVSVFSVSGAHAFLYKNLIKTLGIPALIVTDLDIARTDEETKNLTQISDLNGRETTNKTIINLCGSTALTNIEEKHIDENLYLAYQGNINGYYATSFEEAFILTNYDNVILNEVLSEIKPKIYKNITEEENQIKYSNNLTNSYKWQVKLSNSKGEFGSELLYKLVCSDNDLPKLPKYISDGLDWLGKKLGGC